LRKYDLTHALAAFGAALLPALLLYTAFFSHPAGLFDSVSAFSIYLSRGIDPGPHVQPWYFYLQTLAWSSSEGTVWSEGLILVLAAVGAVSAIAARRRAFWPLYICLYAIGTAAIFSAIRYKTPWNLMPFYAGFILLAGIGVSAILGAARRPVPRAAIVLVLIAAGCQLAAQSVRASFRYGADPRNPYVYAHTSPDFMRLVARVHDLAAVHADGRDLLVKVVAGPYEQWPLPWYARDLTRVGYWIDAASAGTLADVPVIVASQDHAAAVEGALGGGHISEFYGLRPGVLLTLFVERGLWERFLESRQ
jgi:predicted membrane-bound mannosyltransferase